MTPFWKRPEIVAEYVRSLERLPDHQLLAIISEEDPFYYDILELLPEETWIVVCENNPLGAKKNAGMEFARSLEWDYLLELNSDSIVNPALFELYRPYMEKETPFFGLKDLYVVDYVTKESLFIPDYNSGMTYGAGRILHRKALKCNLWTNELQCGMDDNMRGKLNKLGIKDTPVPSDVPMLVDLKTNTTLSHFIILKNMGKTNHNAPKAINIEYDYLVKHIGYDFISQ